MEDIFLVVKCIISERKSFGSSSIEKNFKRFEEDFGRRENLLDVGDLVLNK